MKKTLSLKINLIIFSVVMVIFICLGYLDFRNSHAKAIEGLNEELNVSVERLKTALVYPIWNYNAHEIESIVQSEMLRENICFIQIYDLSTKQYIVNYGRDRNWNVKDFGQSVNKYDAFNEAEASVVKNDSIIARVVVGVTESFAFAQTNALLVKIVLRLSALLLVVGVVLSVIIQLYVVGPILRLKNAFAVAQVDSDVCCLNIKREDEIGQLTRSFVEMHKNINELFKERDSKILELESARKKLLSNEELLKRNQIELEAIYENAPLIMMLVNKDLVIKKLNRHAQLNINKDNDEKHDFTLCDAICNSKTSDCGKCIVPKIINAAFDSSESIYGQEVCLPALSSNISYARHYLISTKRLKELDKELVLLCLQDISQQKYLETKLSQAEKMEAIGHLAGGIAHDFNNVLAAIMGNADIANSLIKEDGLLKKSIIQIVNAAERAKNLVNQILAFSRQETDIRKPIMLSPVVTEVVELLRATLPSTIEISENIVADTKPVLADSTKIHEIVMNLSTNSAYAMEDKGVLKIMHAEELIETPISTKFSIVEPGFYSVITVKDDGEGMSDEVMAHIFEPFYTTKPVGDGTGMGLAVVFGIVASHDGSIVVDSVVGGGTEIKIYLPKVDAVVESSVEPEGVTCKGNERILFVDDEEALVEMSEVVLEDLGYHVDSFNDSQQALEFFKKNSDKFDLVMTDQTMPNMSGLELAKEILRIDPKMPIIICTGYSKVVDETIAKENGIKQLLMKPYKIGELTSAIRSILDTN